MISLSRPSFSCPKPGPPSSSSRNSAHRPWSFTCCWRLRTYALTTGSGERTAYGKTYSSGSTSSLQNSSTQSSFFWNSGSVEKSHAMAVSKAGPALRSPLRLDRLDHPIGLHVLLVGEPGEPEAQELRERVPHEERRAGDAHREPDHRDDERVELLALIARRVREGIAVDRDADAGDHHHGPDHQQRPVPVRRRVAQAHLLHLCAQLLDSFRLGRHRLHVNQLPRYAL